MRISIHPQLGRIMKLTALLLTLGLLEVSAKGITQTVTYSAKNRPLETVFAEIRKQTGYVFFYTSQDLAEATTVSVELKHTPLAAALDMIIKDQPLNYRISEKTIFIGRKIPSAPSVESTADSSLFAPFYTGDIHGRVQNEKGEPVPGIAVMIKEKGKGTYTDTKGEFTLSNVDSGATVTFSGVNIETFRVKLNGITSLVVTVKAKVSDLNQVQIIGYGTTTRMMSTGNITTVKSEDIEKQPVSNILLALQGLVPGMQITSPSGLPGAAPTVQIRGQNSIAAGTSPLYILDGVPIPETQSTIGAQAFDYATLSSLAGINPTDIERVDVLKDGDATAIYGSRGGNGVILITTKKGHSNRTRVNLTAYTGIAKVPHFIDMLNVHQYNAMRREAMANDGITPTPTNSVDLFSYDSTKVHNWQKEFLGKTATTNDIDLSVTGGTENTHFYISAGYHTESTVLPGSTDFSRRSFRGNLNHLSANKRFNLDLSMAYSNSTFDLIQQDLVSFINTPPDYPLYLPDGTPNWEGANGYPLAYLKQPVNSGTGNYTGNIQMGYLLLDGLTLKLNTGFNNSITNEILERPSSSVSPTDYYANGYLQTYVATNNTWIFEPQTEYNRQFRSHHFKLLAGSTFQKNSSQSTNATGSNFPNDALIGDLNSASTQTISNSSSQYAYASVFGRITYDYKQKFLANISFRRDGSSRFGPGRKFGNFGAAGLGWIFSKEKFVAESMPFLSFGKLRTSYGITGNDQIGDYGYISTYSSGSGFGGYDGPSLIPSRLANPNFGWERNRKFEAGLELGFLKDRILLTGSYFRNRSGNQLVYYNVSIQSGFGGYQANFPATVQNEGMEITLATQNVHTADFSWKTTFNLTKSANRLIAFPGIENSSYYQTYFVGKSLGVRQAYNMTGLNAKGVPVFADLNKDGTINSLDRKIIGNNDPFFGGLTNELSYKSVTFSFFINYTRNSNFNNVITAGRVGSPGANFTPYILNRWQKPGDEKITDIPRFTTRSSTYNARYFSQSDVLWRTDNIFRLSNISLAWNLPNGLMQKVKIVHAQLYLHAQNVWVGDKLRKYRLDPLTGNTAMPPLRTITAGLNCTF